MVAREFPQLSRLEMDVRGVILVRDRPRDTCTARVAGVRRGSRVGRARAFASERLDT